MRALSLQLSSLRNWFKKMSDISVCRKCPRLVEHREQVANKKIMRRHSYSDETYWGKPIADFAPRNASDVQLLIVGLAPGAHGANRTGRVFTGDDSGRWLYPALHRFGFARTPCYLKDGDNELIGTAITCVVRCVPPGNKPTPQEIKNCSGFLRATFQSYRPKLILCLGALAWNEAHKLNGLKAPPFRHGLEVEQASKLTSDRAVWIASYHPSRQNTQTGRLTEEMWNLIFTRARSHLSGSASSL